MKKIILHSFIVMLTCFLGSNHIYGQASQKELSEHRKKWNSPAWSDTLRNPYANNLSLTDSGKAMYKKICSVCHGNSGKGDGVAAAGLAVSPADHTSAHVQMQPDGVLFWELSNGHAPMPAYKSMLTEKQRWSLVNYIRTLSAKSKMK